MIEVHNLRKKFGDVEALKGVSFRVSAGEVFGLLGPNGAGKSTTIGILCGLVVPDAGQASLAGIDIARRPVDARRALGVVPQDVALYPEFSARDNLTFFGRLYGLQGQPLRDRIDRVLEQVNLQDRAKEPVERFSGGMLRRLNIAAGLLHEPSVVLLDEPTVGLDPQTRASILDLIRAIASGGAAVLYTTHYLDEAERLCDRIAIIDRGTLVALDSPRALIREHIEPQVIEVTGDGVAAWSHDSAPSFAGRVELVGETAFLYCSDIDTARLACADAAEAKPPLHTLQRPANLEDVFLKLTGRDLRD